MEYNGLWFFGLSGSGKSYSSEYLASKVKNSFIIDGDQVRKFVSFDLGFDIKSRVTQLNRLLGLSKLTIINNFFPICSSVYMNEDIQKELSINNIQLIKLERNFSDVKKNNPTYLNENNIVRIDINYSEFPHKTIINNGGTKFCKDLDQILI